MKKEKILSLRITVLLYLAVLLLPLNYLIISGCQANKLVEIEALNKVALSMAQMQECAGQEAGPLRQACLEKADALLETVGKTYVEAGKNREYVTLFRTDELFAEYKSAWRRLRENIASGDPGTAALLGMQSLNSGMALLETVEKTLLYKERKMLNLLFISLALSMLVMVVVIYFVRVYMQFQINSHATRDMLTGLNNRRYFMEVLRKEQASAVRHSSDLSLMEIEIVGFKSMRQRAAGHAAVAMADFLRTFFRASDTISYARNGQFLIATPCADLTAAASIVERLHECIGAHDFRLGESLNVYVGAVQSGREEDTEELMQRLAKALERARGGENSGCCLLREDGEVCDV